MKRLLAVPFVALGLFGVTGVALADDGDVDKPACADLSGFDPGYVSATSVVTAQIIVDGPSCRNITYSLVVEVDPGTDPLTYSLAGNGTNSVVIQSAPINDDDNTVCVYVTSSRGGREGTSRTLDRVLDSGCTVIAEDGSGGGIGHG